MEVFPVDVHQKTDVGLVKSTFLHAEAKTRMRLVGLARIRIQVVSLPDADRLWIPPESPTSVNEGIVARRVLAGRAILLARLRRVRLLRVG